MGLRNGTGRRGAFCVGFSRRPVVLRPVHPQHAQKNTAPGFSGALRPVALTGLGVPGRLLSLPPSAPALSPRLLPPSLDGMRSLSHRISSLDLLVTTFYVVFLEAV